MNLSPLQLADAIVSREDRQQVITTVAEAAVAVARKVFDQLRGRDVLVLGDGQQALPAANSFAAEAEVWRSTQRLEGPQLSLLPAAADVIVIAVDGERPFIGAEALREGMRQRRHRPLLLIDLSSPPALRDDVAEVSSVFSFCLEDLQRLIATSAVVRAHAVRAAETCGQAAPGVAVPTFRADS